ncbi:MAG TPA: hypothetical protein VGM90_33500 [Kofleriaceae bacterium]|jgi:hypothetical protein
MKAAIAVLLLAVGCDAKATASDPGSSTRPENKSKEYESCGTSAHCADDLRCFDNVCQRVTRSTVGDYYAAVGKASLASGDVNAAIAGYKEALKQYENEKVALPGAVGCDYGAALTAGRANKENAELAARTLHGCLLAVPPGSSVRAKAMLALAQLNDAGLEPTLLGQAQLASAYLTRAPQKPATDRLVVALKGDPAPAKTMPLIEAKAAEADTKGALVACWDAYHSASKKDAVSVTMTVKSAFYQNPDYDDEGRFILKIDPAVGLPAGTPDAAVDTCVRAVMEPAIKSLKIAENFTTKLTISVK